MFGWSVWRAGGAGFELAAAGKSKPARLGGRTLVPVDRSMHPRLLGVALDPLLVVANDRFHV